MCESTASFSDSIKEISNSMTDIGHGICRSIELLSHAMLQQTQNRNPPHVNQNLFYQNEMVNHHYPQVVTQSFSHSTPSRHSAAKHFQQRKSQNQGFQP